MADVPAEVEALYCTESGRILATLVRLIGDLDLAEDAMHEGFAAALRGWEANGVPENPRAWVISAARFRAIDAIRRRVRTDASIEELALRVEGQAEGGAEDDGEIDDDRLRLIFTCCHPCLAPEAQVALTLREVCGLTTEEIARAFLVTPSTLAQRIVRAKAAIREKRIPYEVPSRQELPERLSAVLQVVYLVFNEGYSATASTAATRAELCGLAIHLGRVLHELLPEPEVTGLLALLLLLEARRAARTTAEGDVVLLEEQDRSLWNGGLIAEGVALVETALTTRRFGAYTLQAAIAAVHAEAASPAETDWRQIRMLYDRLVRVQPSPVVELNRAVAIAMADGLEGGLRIVERLLEQGELARYHLAHAARADLCRRLGRVAEARSSYETALALALQEPERKFLTERLRALG